MTSVFRQLYLFDCDGGRGNLFSALQRDQIPNNSQLYIFWNNNDEVITKKLQQQVGTYPNVHLAPSHLKNVKNSADGKLIYFLGKLVREFDTITIVGGGDCVYEEVIEAVKYDYPKKEITVKKIERPSSSELAILLKCPLINAKNNSDENDGKLVNGTLQTECRISTRSIPVVSGQRIRCPECPTSVRDYSPGGLRQHLSKARKHSKKISKLSKGRVSVTEKRISCPNGKMKLIHPSIGGVLEISTNGKKCPLCSTSKQKYKAIPLYKHLEESHPECANIQIQCCEQITYNDLNTFRQHVLNAPIIYQIYA